MLKKYKTNKNCLYLTLYLMYLMYLTLRYIFVHLFIYSDIFGRVFDLNLYFYLIFGI